jgi:elongation factor P--(R)-beta-lysine ligase
LISRTPCPTPAATGEFYRLVFAGEAERLRDSARAAATTRAYFAEQRFVEVSTPLRVPAPGVDFHVDAIEASGQYLITSPELEMKRLLVGGMPRIFQLARVARADEDGPLHAPEFTMLEWYRAFSGLEDVLADTEALVRRVVRELSGEHQVFVLGQRKVDVSQPFERITVRDAFARYADVADAARLAERNEDRYFELLVSRVEPALAARPRPVFLTHYPISQAALSRPDPADPRVAERAELYFGGVELCNAYGELCDPSEQRRRMLRESKRRRASKRPVYPLDEPFLAALVEGMPPSAGNALGFDRLVMVATNRSTIR